MLDTRLTIIFVGFLTALAYLSLNAGLPAFPELEQYFSVVSPQMKNCMTIFLLSYAFAQPFWGTLSDRFGRRNIILIACTIALIGAFITASAVSIHSYALGLFIQAVGIGAGTIMARSILVDSSNKQFIQTGMAVMAGVIAIMPSLSHIIGGHLLIWFDRWRSIYIFMLALTCVVLALIFFHYKESNTQPLKQLNFADIKKIYISLLHNKKFMGYCIPYNLAIGTLVTFYALSPYIFIRHLHLAENRYGYLLLLISLSYLGGIVLMRFLQKSIDSNKLMLAGCLLTLSAGLMFALFHFFFSFSLLTILLPIICYALGCGFISPIANAKALEAVSPEYRGSAASFLGAGIMVVSAVLNTLLSPFEIDTLISLATFILVVAAVKGMLFYRLILKEAANQELS